jgi:glycosyltransferase involved in cell wall biosynthesis
MKQRVLIVVPEYNEEKTIAMVLKGLNQFVPGFDRVVVNDGSKDATGDIVTELGERQLKLVCNLGYGPALQTGLKYGLARRYDIVVSFDADGQHQPEDVSRVVEVLVKKDVDVVIGSRFCEGRAYTGPLGRRLGQILFSHLTRMLIGRRIYDTTSGFKALRATACEEVVRTTFVDLHTEMIVRLSLLGFKIAEIPVSVRARSSGQSMHSFVSLLKYPLKTLLVTMVAVVDVFIGGRRAR